MHTPFSLDTRLQSDCFVLGKLGLSHLLLMNNALFSWFILVPETQVFEICDLEEHVQHVLLDEVNRLSGFIRQHFAVDKLNVAAIGNVVRQLHVHVIGRRQDDICWPGVVWGSGKTKPYDDRERFRIEGLVRGELLPLYA